MSIEIQPYFAEGERYPALVGVRAEGDEYETAYVSKSELVDALAENEKLRELVTGLYKCWVNEGCEGCPMQDDDGWCVRDIRLHEMGVEGTE